MESSDPDAICLHSTRYGETRPLKLRPKFFLGHYEFVRFLHDKLYPEYHDGAVIFFDEKSLPTAEPISRENILIEARGCQLGVLVLSENFFTHSPNPMLELEALTDNEVPLLLLFYKINVDAFNKMRSEKVWEERWQEWRVVDEGRIDAWRRALNLVNKYSGLEYCKLTTNDLEYIYKIVKKVTCIIRPAVSISEEGLFGMNRLCEIVNVMYNECSSKRSTDRCMQVASTSARAGHGEDSNNTLDLVGIYGFAGLGKTTLCKCLCDFHSAEFHGKVCWIDLGRSLPSNRDSSPTYSSNAFLGRMNHILCKLTGNIDCVDNLTFD